MKKSALSIILFSLLSGGPALASTIVLEGAIDNTVSLSQERVFNLAQGGLSKLIFRFARPASFKGAFLSQRIADDRLSFDPKPDSVTAETDPFGNAFTVAEWTNLKKDPVVRESFNVEINIELKEIKSAAPYPLPRKDMTGEGLRFLKKTPMVQSEAIEIKRLAARLTEGAASEQAAASSILNWVVDNIRYRTPIPSYDALWTLSAKEGNCQNFSHLSIALLRASGIPARIVGGISLGKTWKVPLKDGALLQSIGQGGHAWIEIWYPDIGWVPYDAQQSHLFVGPRHIKETVGLDSSDINDSWRASPHLPRYREEIAAEYLMDSVNLRLRETLPTPENYILTASAMAAKAAPSASAAAPAQAPAPAPGAIEFGNMDFPGLMDLNIRAEGQSGMRTFDKETAEYVTGEETFAQAFALSGTLRLETVSLAMHKFGGRFGSLWIDVVRDDGGRPGMEGIRSLPLNLDTVAYTPGYIWFDFRFPGHTDPVTLSPGRYWIILRHTRDAIISWFYTPGNRYGGPDDARGTAAGINWSNILNYDFNFKVRGYYTGN